MKNRKPETEQRLDRGGASWHPEENVPLAKIDTQASRRNQARFEPLHQEQVDDIAIYLGDGGELPPLVGHYNKKGYIVLIDGNHRHEAYIRAAQLGFKTITTSDFYIVDGAPDWLIERLTRTINIGQGTDVTREEKLGHAMYFRKTQNISIEGLATLVQLPASSILDAIQASDVKERLSKQGFTDILSPKTFQALYKIKQDRALLEAARLIKDASLNSDEAREVARRVNRAASSEKQQQNELERIRGEYRSRILRVRRGLNRGLGEIVPSIKLMRALKSISLIRPKTVVPFDLDMLKHWRYARKKMEEIEIANTEALGEP